jgi:hypothetical protein
MLEPIPILDPDGEPSSVNLTDEEMMSVYSTLFSEGEGGLCEKVGKVIKQGEPDKWEYMLWRIPKPPPGVVYRGGGGFGAPAE